MFNSAPIGSLQRGVAVPNLPGSSRNDLTESLEYPGHSLVKRSMYLIHHNMFQQLFTGNILFLHLASTQSLFEFPS